MIFTNVMKNLDYLSQYINTPYRYDYDYNNKKNLTDGKKGKISVLINLVNREWNILVIITNPLGAQSVKQLSIFRRNDNELVFNGYWESLSFQDVKKIICEDPNWSMSTFWKDFIHRLETLTSNMIIQINQQQFEDTLFEAHNNQINRHRRRNGTRDEENIFPWYLRTARNMKKEHRDKIKRKYGYEVVNWLYSNKLTLVFTSDLSKSKGIYINDLEIHLN
ncbi:hypothetical protein [Enterococcus hirae]|uniref:hypothetical protein n=1 Tax=Enterococcus hirae TaxID=1354 RepID=UPI001A96BDD0|nr:hypothetical protein [Enterococcus hirae]MBO1134961.1 hypothetical protein [Enterococcus hirae]